MCLKAHQTLIGGKTSLANSSRWPERENQLIVANKFSLFLFDFILDENIVVSLHIRFFYMKKADLIN